MTGKKSRYINVDELMPQISVEQAAAYYGIPLPELHRVANEVRTRCFLNCGCEQQTGDRALAIKADDPARKWRCHQYGCGRGGNLVSLCDLIKPGPHMDGKPRGDRFKEIAEDLQAMAGGATSAVTATPQPAKPTAPPQGPPPANVPLKDSPNERARELVNLHEDLVTDLEVMNPQAAAYFRRRPYLTEDVCRQWRMGYMPSSSKSSLRGKIVYPLLSAAGDVLTWFTRDPHYEDKHRKWVDGGKQGREPEKFHFVKGFHRGLELFGQHQFNDQHIGKDLVDIGLPVVEGPNDVIRMEQLAVPTVGLLSNTITADQVQKITRLARQLTDGRVLLMLDADQEGDNGARQALWELAQHCQVRLAWSREMHGGQFADRQPESLSAEEWESLREAITAEQ